MNLYFDASALVKRHLRELGTLEVKQAFDAADIVGTTVISRVETEAALAKAVRTGDVTDKQAQAVLDDFRNDWPDFAQVPVTNALVRRAGALAFNAGLRGYDAVQLASALVWKEGVNETVLFATFDLQLWKAARRHPLRPFPNDLPAMLEA